MTQTVTRLFDSYNDATRAIDELGAMGIDRNDLSILGNRGEDATTTGTHAAHDHGIDDVNDHGDVNRGASTGAVLGGVGGLLAGLGLLAIPGLGPIVAAGWLAATVTGAGIGAAGGAATGGIVGALKNAGHTDEDANVYSEGVRRGGTLVSARVPDDQVAPVEAVMQRYNAADATSRGADYRAGGWDRFDESAPAYRNDAGSDGRRTDTGY
ncbi:MAG: general stress protein [Bradyrhizobium sp.]